LSFEEIMRPGIRRNRRGPTAALAQFTALAAVPCIAAGQAGGVAPIAQAAQRLEAVEITVSPLRRVEIEALQPASVLRDEELRAREATNLGETLSREPGVQSSAYGAGSGRPIIRGMDSARVRITESGLGVADVSGASPDHRVAADAFNSNQVEIMRGPATLMYGSGAIGGLVNIVSERIPLARRDALGAELGLKATSAETERTASASLAGMAGADLGWRIEGFSQRSKDYDLAAPLVDADGEVLAQDRLPNSDTDTWSAAIGGAWFGAVPGTRIGLAAQRYESDYGIPNPAEPVTIALRRSRYELDADSGSAFGVFSGVRSKFGFTDYRHTEREPDGAAGARFENRSIEGRIELPHRPLAGFSGVLGVQLLQADTSGQGEGELPKTQSQGWALFAVEERRFGALRLELGLRYENAKYDVEADYGSGERAPSRSFSLFSASAGLGWDFAPGWLAAVTLTSAQRAPSVEELYFVGAHPATFAFEIGDPGLAKEKSSNVDLALQYAAGPWRARATLFANRVGDYVYGFFDGSTTDIVGEDGEVEESLSNLRYAQADARLRGGEIELRYGAGSGLQLRLWGDAVRGRLDSGPNDGGNLPRMSPSRAGLDVGWRADRWQALLAVTRVFDQNRTSDFDLRDGEPESATPGFTRLDAYLSWRLGKAVSIWFQGRNLTNEDMRIHTSFLKDFAPPPARSFWLGLRAAL
jgi:iron complex outermembrane receptor protein